MELECPRTLLRYMDTHLTGCTAIRTSLRVSETPDKIRHKKALSEGASR